MKLALLRSACGIVLAGAATLALAQAAFDLDQLTTTEAAKQICAGHLSSEALVAAELSRARAKAELNAFVTLDENGALAAAKAADAARRPGRACKPLAGVPLVVKDNIHVAGLPSSAGTAALKGFTPKADAPVVKKLRDAGAFVLGKTNMHELAFGISGYNPTFKSGTEPGVRNAYDTARMAGGSSSGNGAALGSRIALAALGTDTGGSVRIPCALNGCASLRPTVGRYSQAGIAPISHTNDTAGPMAQTMADVELLDRVIAGGKPARAASLKGLRVGLVSDFQANLDDDTRAAMTAALDKMRAAGVQVVEVEMPRLAELNGAVGFPVALYEAYDDMVVYLAKYGTGVSIEQLAAQIASPDVKGAYNDLVIPRKLPGPNDTLVDAAPVYANAMKHARPALQKLYRDTFAKHRLTALVFATVPHVALPATPDASSLANFGLFIQNTYPGANAGVPGINIPVALGTLSGLPVGIELDGPKGSDRRLIAIGMALQDLFGRLPAPK